jgi:integrase
MQRSETRRSALKSVESTKALAKRNGWHQVFDDRKRRVRGLWRRNGVFYAQLSVGRKPTRFKLDSATTVPEAVSAQHALKAKQRAGTLKRASDEVTNIAEPGAHTIRQMIEAYQEERDTLDAKDPKTIERENSSLKKWIKFAGKLTLEAINNKLRKDFAKWRKKQKNKKGKKILGRTIDIDIMTFGQAIKFAIDNGWLRTIPVGKWKNLGKKPKKQRLIETSELAEVRKTSVDECPLRGQLFADYLGLLAYTGGREKETLPLEWDKHVHWDRRQFEFPGGKRGGGSQQAGEPRFIDFFPKLEAHLHEMYKRRDKSSPYLFPSHDFPADQPTITFKQIWKKVRKAAKIFGTEKDIKFHLFRHYFISHCVMAGIDFMTIAVWVGHRDGGILIGKVYGHLRPGHSANEAKKLGPKAWD